MTDLPGRSLSDGAIGVGRTMMRPFPKVTDWLVPLLGQIDAVRRPVTICGSNFAWTGVLRRAGGKDDG
jgi:hypothetical protein